LCPARLCGCHTESISVETSSVRLVSTGALRPFPSLCQHQLMTISAPERTRRLTPTMRGGERVSALELFFDLVFVLALTQCTALIAARPTWLNVVRAMLVLGVLWWSWCGYAWLTSVVDPEDTSVRLVIFAAMAAMLVAALSVHGAFGSTTFLFAGAYAALRAAHIALFILASREDPALRHSVIGLAISTTIGVGLLFAAAAAGGNLRLALWVVALALDLGGPLVIDAEGWRFVPGHFAERHGGIIIIALGESIVAIGIAADTVLNTSEVVAAVLGVAVAAALWWLYFDVVALVAARRLAAAPAGRERNQIARDSYSYLHYPMVAGIALVAVGLKETLGHVHHELTAVEAAAMFGGAAVYLLAHVAFRLRNVRTLNRQRLSMAAVLLALVPAAYSMPALAALSLLTALLVLLIAFEALRFAEARARVRSELLAGPAE
jgi:low temperature requirement protein LtrA